MNEDTCLHHLQPTGNWGVFVGTSWSYDNHGPFCPLLTRTRKGQLKSLYDMKLSLWFWLYAGILVSVFHSFFNSVQDKVIYGCGNRVSHPDVEGSVNEY